MDSYDWFQMVFLVLFYVAFLGRTIQLTNRGIRPFVLGIGKKGFKAGLELSFLVGLVVWTIELVSIALHLDFHFFPALLYEDWFELRPLKGLGIVLIACGYLLFLWALKSFGDSWRVGIDKTNPGSLITGGAFAYSRNPIFVFLDLYFLSTCLIYPNTFFTVFALVVAFGIHFQIVQEEQFLLEQYGDDYRAYTGRVRRYL
jgi:protein-S-isoprenylcysteine O-methyltransferase Ste14